MYNIFNDFLFSPAISKIYHKKEWGFDDKKPWYFAVEGIDGSGKTYFSNALSNLLSHEKIPFIQVHEPFTDLDPMKAKAIDYQKDREKFYKEFKDRGKWIISDRSLLSTLAYQRVPEEEVIHMKQWLHSKEGLGDYNLCLCFMNSTYESAQENLRKRTGGNLEEIEKKEELQRRALNRYRMAIHREVFDFDCLLKITPNILP